MTAGVGTRPLVLYGGGGFGREVALLVHAINALRPTWDLLGFIDDKRGRGDTYRGLSFLGGIDRIVPLAERHRGPLSICICLGERELLRTLPQAVRSRRPDVEFPTMIHPTASIDPQWVEIGEGSVIGAGVTVTADVRIGSFNIVNMNTVLAHDVVIGTRCQVNPGAIINGGVNVGDDVTIGAGAVLMPRISVGAGSTIALGAVVAGDVRPGELVAGNPSRVIRRGMA